VSEIAIPDAGPFTGERFDLGAPLIDSPAGDPAVRPFALRGAVNIPNASADIAGRYCPVGKSTSLKTANHCR
jgi:hypothetical protein